MYIDSWVKFSLTYLNFFIKVPIASMLYHILCIYKHIFPYTIEQTSLINTKMHGLNTINKIKLIELMKINHHNYFIT